MVQPERDGGSRLIIYCRCGEVAGVAGQWIISRHRQRRDGIESLRQRAKSAHWYLIIGEWLSLIVNRIGRIAIVELLIYTIAIDQAAEVSISHGLRRNVLSFIRELTIRKPLVSEKEKASILSVINFRNKNAPH